MASSLAEESFCKRMDAKYMSVSVEVFSLESVKNIKLIKPKDWIGDVEQQQHLFEHIVARYLWKHVYELLPSCSTAPRAQALRVFCENFHMDIATGWPLMIKAFLKCIAEFGVLQPDEMFAQKTIPELMRMKYRLFEMNAAMMDEQYRQVYDFVDLIYSKTMTSLVNRYISKYITSENDTEKTIP
jgi:hypothetical protein